MRQTQCDKVTSGDDFGVKTTAWRAFKVQLNLLRLICQDRDPEFDCYSNFLMLAEEDYLLTYSFPIYPFSTR